MENNAGCQWKTYHLSEARKLSGFIAHDLSVLIWSPMEVTDETDGVAAGNSEDAIWRDVFWIDLKAGYGILREFIAYFNGNR